MAAVLFSFGAAAQNDGVIGDVVDGAENIVGDVVGGAEDIVGGAENDVEDIAGGDRANNTDGASAQNDAPAVIGDSQNNTLSENVGRNPQTDGSLTAAAMVAAAAATTAFAAHRKRR